MSALRRCPLSSAATALKASDESRRDDNIEIARLRTIRRRHLLTDINRFSAGNLDLLQSKLDAYAASSILASLKSNKRNTPLRSGVVRTILEQLIFLSRHYFSPCSAHAGPSNFDFE